MVLSIIVTGCSAASANKEVVDQGAGNQTPSEELKDLLNRGIARELRVSIQYMWQHIICNDAESQEFQNELRSIAVNEMGHAKAIAERLYALGGVPTTKSEDVTVGSSLKEMFENDKREEAGALKLYTRTIELAGKLGDEITVRLFRKILQDEQEHYDTFSAFLEKVK
ncbi:MAG: ferritin-like domain-containing protein [Planctomycetes bacterium]|nr:ferritin-like domain-containing protein [Planctomycetota bacterium]